MEKSVLAAAEPFGFLGAIVVSFSWVSVTVVFSVGVLVVVLVVVFICPTGSLAQPFRPISSMAETASTAGADIAR